MRCSKLVVAVIAVFSVLYSLFPVPSVAQGPTYHMGKAASADEIRAMDIAIGPSGKELPTGSGSAKEGAAVYASKCAKCHGLSGSEAPLAPPLVGGKGTLNTLHPLKTVGSYWPFATTVWDYINRAMPVGGEGSLTADQVYSLTAFLLYKNGIIQENDVLDAKSLPKVQMPNRNGFIPLPLPDWKKYQTLCRAGTCP